MNELIEKHCKACEGGTSPLDEKETAHYLKKLQAGWELSTDGKEIRRKFAFKNYYHTMAFVNALAYIANTENHHPDLEVSYNRCLVKFTTHAISGLSENDFICAAKTDALLSDKN